MRRRITLGLVRLRSAVSDRDYGPGAAPGCFWTKDQTSSGYRPSFTFFEETAIPSPSASSGFVDPRNIVAPLVAPTRVERSVPLKALVAQINYNLFDIELGQQQSQFAYLQAKDLADTVDGVLRTHDVALWNGSDTSLSSPTTPQYFGAAAQIAAGGNTTTIGASQSIVDGFKSTIAQMVANSSYGVRPTAIYANPVLLDLIDREMKSEFNVVLNTKELRLGFR